MEWFFISDLHGHIDRYRKLFAAMEDEVPAVVLLGGDLLPAGLSVEAAAEIGGEDFINGFLGRELAGLRERMGERFPRVLVILGNDDPRVREAAVLDMATRGLWEYVHEKRCEAEGHSVYGYAYVPPTPFALKDWERYDVSRHVDLGCVSPEAGQRTIPVSDQEVRYATIAQDLERLAADDDVEQAIFLFHSPPYQTRLDRAALDGMMIEHAPVDVHVGSIAIQRFIQSRQPLLTLHGHVHESARLTGSWKDGIGRTVCLSAAHDGAELALVRFTPRDPASATRELV